MDGNVTLLFLHVIRVRAATWIGTSEETGTGDNNRAQQKTHTREDSDRVIYTSL